MAEPLEFKTWMLQNTKLRETSILVYDRAIRAFEDTQTPVDIPSINAYITEHARYKRSSYMRYAFKYYLTYKGLPELYKSVVKVQHHARKNVKKHHPRELVLSLIAHIKIEKYRDIGHLAYATGARPAELLRLREEYIDTHYKPEVIKIVVISKGGGERVLFVKKTFEPLLKKYLKGRAGFLFINNELITEEDVIRTVNTERTKFYLELRKAAKVLELERFGTHDFRRNYAESRLRQGDDPRKVQKQLGHRKLTTTMLYFDENPPDIEASMLSHQEGML